MGTEYGKARYVLYTYALGINQLTVQDRQDKPTQYFHMGNTSHNPPRGQPGHDKLCHVSDVLEGIRAKRSCNIILIVRSASMRQWCASLGTWASNITCWWSLLSEGLKCGSIDPHNGFVNDLQIYNGKDIQASYHGLGERVILKLSIELRGKNHQVFYDNSSS